MAVVPLKEESTRRKRELLRRCKGILDKLAREEGLSHSRVVDSVLQKDEVIPVSVFSNSQLGILEIAVKYLKDEKGYSLTDISGLLHRDTSTIWFAYRDATEKFPGKIAAKRGFAVPVSVFTDRGLGVLESIVVYLKDGKGLRLSEIALLLKRSPRTIWTVYHRARRKNAQA
jgi:hypothetical protein